MTYIIIINDGNGAAHLLFALQICCPPFSTGLDSGKYKEERRKEEAENKAPPLTFSLWGGRGVPTSLNQGDTSVRQPASHSSMCVWVPVTVPSPHLFRPNVSNSTFVLFALCRDPCSLDAGDAGGGCCNAAGVPGLRSNGSTSGRK